MASWSSIKFSWVLPGPAPKCNSFPHRWFTSQACSQTSETNCTKSRTTKWLPLPLWEKVWTSVCIGQPNRLHTLVEPVPLRNAFSLLGCQSLHAQQVPSGLVPEWNQCSQLLLHITTMFPHHWLTSQMELAEPKVEVDHMSHLGKAWKTRLKLIT
jgi:hypothetical protein